MRALMLNAETGELVKRSVSRLGVAAPAGIELFPKGPCAPTRTERPTAQEDEVSSLGRKRR